ncbi:alginate export protein [Chitinophaga japonensis]|uniref:Alginate export protein n=2 Tax=Chitinophaga japonensis TaxID=104662 RepID=A0A562T168_CHIJA|nr:alginate export protein [Chitinophaga japonensis]
MRVLFSRTGRRIAAMLTVCLACNQANSQSFGLMRFDEHYEQYRDSTRTFYNGIKYTPLNSRKTVYVTAGGELRWEYVDFRNEDWGRLGLGHNSFLLQRYNLHADLHAGPHFRLFVQVRSAWENGRKNGPRPIDEDKLNIQNLFVDAVILHKPHRTLTARLGKQELNYGSGRLISVQEAPNLRLAFTGAKLMYATPNLAIDGFLMMADSVRTGAFDNKPTRELNFWGVYTKIIIPRFPNIDLYYLGFRRDGSEFEEGREKERRHSLGARIWRHGGGFIYNLESVIQFGTFGAGRIRAWTASADLGYHFRHAWGQPSINLRNDYISGDRQQGDGHLQTFNPLYPKGGYFGFSPQIGPVNLIDIHPYANVHIGKQLLAQADVVMNWRYSLQDGVYRPSGGFNFGGAASRERYIGTAYLASLVYTPNRFASLNCGIQYFRVGAFVKDLVAAPENGVFVNARLTFKF